MSLTKLIQNDGVIALDQPDTPLDVDEWDRLDQLTSDEEIYSAPVFDGKPMYFFITAELLKDRTIPETVPPKNVAENVLAIIGSDKMMDFYKQVLDEEGLYIRRAGIIWYPPGGFLGQHADQEKVWPHYLAAVVLHFSEDFSGGEYVAYLPGGKTRTFSSKRGSMTVTRNTVQPEALSWLMNLPMKQLAPG